MSLSPLSRLVRQAVATRLADPSIGWNARMAEAAALYDLKPQPKAIDFSSKSRQFIMGQINPVLMENTSSFTYPLIALYTHGVINKNYEKFHPFSGDCVLGLDVWWSWSPSNTLQDYETFTDSVEEVVLEIINGFGPSGLGESTQNWGPLLVYNGGVTCSRTDLALASNNWLQALQFRITFGVETSV
jgi:hypothetical protein